MNSRQQKANEYLLNGMTIFVLAALLLSFILIFVTEDNALKDYSLSAVRIEDRWIDHNALPVDMSDLSDSEIAYVFLSEKEVERRDLCFESRNVNFKVFINNRLIYEYNPVIPAIFGKTYGVCYHTIHLPDFHGERELKIEVHPAYEGNYGYIKNIKLQDGSDYVATVFRTNVASFTLSVFVLVIGFMLIVGGYAASASGAYAKEIISMGVFAMLAAVWTATETPFMRVICSNPPAVHLMSYMSLILLPGAAVVFVGFLTKSANEIAIRIMGYASIILCMLDIILSLTGVTDYHGMLIFTHIQLVIAAILSIYYIVSAIRRKVIQKHHTIFVNIALLFIVTGGVIDLIRYYISSTASDTAVFFRYGLLVFIVLMSVHEIRELFRFRKYETEAYSMRQLAHTDALTGMPNRMAFNELLEKLETSKRAHGVIVQLDLNYLKHVNDQFGHAEGDKQIVAAAEAIKTGFAKDGDCFRVGGDEFVAVITTRSPREKCDECIKKMINYTSEYNAREDAMIPLEIAYGICEFDTSKIDIDKALQNADMSMYKMKNDMKQCKVDYSSVRTISRSS